MKPSRDKYLDYPWWDVVLSLRITGRNWDKYMEGMVWEHNTSFWASIAMVLDHELGCGIGNAMHG